MAYFYLIEADVHSCEAWLLYQLDEVEKSGIIDLFREDIDIMNKI